MLNIIQLLLLSQSLIQLTKATTKCDPLTATGCTVTDAAFSTSTVSVDFSDKANVNDYFEKYSDLGTLDYTSSGLNFTLNKRFDNPSLQSKFYIFFGKIEVICVPAAGKGIVSTVYLQSDDLDEIDLEWIGTETTQVQTNWFSKGNTSTYDRGAYDSLSDSSTDLFSNAHNYTIDWTKESINWYIDDELVRTVGNDSSEGYPQSPMAVFIGVWAGGDPSNSEGTIEWAGGETDYSDAPFSMLVQSMKIENYSGGEEYTYKGTSGDWEDIEINGESVSTTSSKSVSSSTSSSSSSSSKSSSSSTSASSSFSITTRTLSSTTSDALQSPDSSLSSASSSELDYSASFTVSETSSVIDNIISSSSSVATTSSSTKAEKGEAAGVNFTEKKIVISLLCWCLSLLI